MIDDMNLEFLMRRRQQRTMVINGDEAGDNRLSLLRAPRMLRCCDVVGEPLDVTFRGAE
jgi:hypothetical protein